MMLGLTSFSQVIPNKDLVVQALSPTGLDVTGLATAIDYTTGAVYTCGYINTVSSGKDLIVVKLDSNLVQQWVATYDFTGLDDKANAICIDGSGNVYVTGGSFQGSGNMDLLTIKYNSSGAQQWASRVNGTNNTNDMGTSLLFDGSNVWVTGYVTTTGKGKDAVLLKLNGSTGATIASPKRNGTANGDDTGEKICTDGTSVFIAGTTKNTTTNGDVFIACVNISSATLTWSISVNGTANGDESGLDCTIDNGELYVCGYTNNTTTGNDYYFARINKSNGTVNYSNTYDGGYNGSDMATALVPDKLGNYAITGIATNGSNNEYHTQLYSTSALLWTHKQPLNGAYTSTYPQIAMDTIAQHFYVCGGYYNATIDGILYQLSPSGTKMWTQYHNGTNGARDVFIDLVVDGLGRIFACSPNETGTATNIYDFMVIRYSQTPVYMPVNYSLVTDTFAINHLYYPNQGQIVDSTRTNVASILYHTAFASPAEFIQKNKVSFCLFKHDTSMVHIHDTATRVDMVFSGANEYSEMFPFYFQDNNKLNYFTTGDTLGITNIKGAAQLLIPNIYPMIDLHITSNGKGSKYFFVVKPTGDPNNLRLYFDGASSTATVSGNLKITMPLGSFTFNKPDIYNVSVPSFTNLTITTTSITGTTGWVSLGSDTYSINPGSYNTAWPLVIEFDMGKSPPSAASAIGNLEWSTYYGGSNIDEVRDVKVDNSNNLYTVGQTLSNNFPNAIGSTIQAFNYGSYDGFISKFANSTNPGVPIWTTYIGGENTEYLNSLDFGPNGDIYSVGASSSNNTFFPSKTKLGAYGASYQGPLDSVHIVTPFKQATWHYDGLICQINANGDSLKWLTRVCHSFSDSDESFEKIKFDPFGDFFAVGYTRSVNTPTFGPVNSYTRAYNNGSYNHLDMVTDGWITKFNSSSSLAWSTTIGASTATNTSGYPPDDYIKDIAFDANGDVYVAGYTQGNNYVTAGGGSATSGQYDGVITRFDNNGVMKWSTHLGGSGYDWLYSINTNTNISSHLYVTGSAQSGFPTTNGGYYYDNSHNGGTDDAFFTVYDNSNTRIHSTYLGGNGTEEGRDVEIDNAGVIHISGKTKSTNFYTPSPNNGYNATPTGVGKYDLFVCSLFSGINDLFWTGIIGSDNNDADGYPNEVEMSIDNSQAKLYLGSMARSPSFSVPYPVLGSVPTYTQNPNGNSDASISEFDLSIIHSLVGISEIKKLGNDVYIYPNPTTSVVNIKILNFKDKFNYIVYNGIGQSVLSGTISEYDNSIDLKGLKTGMYFLELNNSKERLSTKIIKVE